MSDSEILLAIILRFGVNVGVFTSWYVENLGEHTYQSYLEINEAAEITMKNLDEFSFKFLVASLTWKGLI